MFHRKCKVCQKSPQSKTVIHELIPSHFHILTSSNITPSHTRHILNTEETVGKEGKRPERKGGKYWTWGTNWRIWVWLSLWTGLHQIPVTLSLYLPLLWILSLLFFNDSRWHHWRYAVKQSLWNDIVQLILIKVTRLNHLNTVRVVDAPASISPVFNKKTCQACWNNWLRKNSHRKLGLIGMCGLINLY